MKRSQRPSILGVPIFTVAFACAIAWATPAFGAHIFIDPGHGGIYSNANLPSLGIYEKNVNLQIAQRLHNELVSRGHTVRMSRTSDVTVGVTDRAISFGGPGGPVC